ncbi:hypothetical protein TIFTF001_016098 [Ficus carica]|uniref:Uncharacterized protein n=1 Tax=Ficus carica TaxID=3494 RepID=A0AA87ZZR3_FICCA|nr:hypothetical protein TIFTF001_016098 [Ficus carica]
MISKWWRSLHVRRQWRSHNFFRGGEQVGVYSLGINSWTSMEMPDLFSCLVDSSALISRPWKTCSVALGPSICLSTWLVTLCRRFRVISSDREVFRIENISMKAGGVKH